MFLLFAKKSTVAGLLHTLKDEGLSVLLSESDYSHSTGLVDQVYTIERGAVSAPKHVRGKVT